MEKIKSILIGMAMLGYFALGFVQLGAVYSFFSDYWGWWFIFAGPVAFFISYIPFVGAIAGTIAAHQVWNWSLFGSILLFFWPYALYIPALFIGGAAGIAEKIHKKKAS